MDIRQLFKKSSGDSVNSGEKIIAGRQEIHESSTECLPKKLKFNYERNRKRLVLDNWLKEFTWLDTNNERTEMWCKVCRAFPNIADVSSSYFKITAVKGDAIRISSVRAHNKTKKHILCIKAKLALDEPTATPMRKCLVKLTVEQHKKMSILFNTAFFCAKEEMAFSKFRGLCELQIKNGIVCGNNYLNDKGGAEFCLHIAEVMKEDLIKELEKVRFITVMADGSTDRSTIEKDIVYVRFISSGKPVTRFVELVELEYADASGVYAALIKSLESVNINEDIRLEKIICINLDGASVNMGKYAGVAAIMTKDIPHLISLHCIAHKLELAITDALKNSYIKGQFEDTIKGIVKFYSRSPKQRRQLVEMSNFLEISVAQMGSVSQIRWLSSQQRSLLAVQKNLPLIVMHLENAAADRNNAKSFKAVGYLKELRLVRFTQTLHYWLDIVDILVEVSKKFQADDFTVLDITNTLEAACLQLEALRHVDGPHLKAFKEKFEGNLFNGIKLKGKEMQNEDLLDDVLHCVGCRFQNLQKSKPVSLFNVFNFNFWPLEDTTALATYGNNEIAELCNHYNQILSEGEICLAKREWSNLKVIINKMRESSSSLLHVYSYLLMSKQEDLKNILILVEIMLCISPSTSACERGFSAMNRIKNPLRCNMSTETINNLMRISIDGDVSGNFDPSAAIEHWMFSTKGTRHVDGHACQKIVIEESEFSNSVS